MFWKSSNPVCSILIPRLNVQDYKKDMKFDFIKGDFVLNEYVNGFDSFIQKFIKVLLTNETQIIKYGLFELLPKSNIQNVFDKECEVLAKAIVLHKLSDSTPESPNGLGYTVEQIYSISKENIDSVSYLLVDAKVTGINDRITINVPLKLVESNM